jgi:low affinity Fe/Cu permease
MAMSFHLDQSSAVGRRRKKGANGIPRLPVNKLDLRRLMPGAGKRTARRYGMVGRSGAFQRFARAGARMTGHPLAFGLAVAAIVAWGLTGPLFGFSDTWQLIINTATTVITFLMVFLIQNTQNRDSEAMQLKLDELVRATAAAHNALLDIEELSEQELDLIKTRYEHLARKAREDLHAGRSDLGSPDVKDSG